MCQLSDLEILKTQESIQKSCQGDLFEFFDAAQELFVSMLSSAKIQSGQEIQTTEIKEYSIEQIQIYQKWITVVLKKAIMISGYGETDEYAENPPDALELPRFVGQRLIKDILQILSCGRDLSDGGLLFIGDVGEALSLEASQLDTLIEGGQYQKRRDFTEILLDCLDEVQCYWIASMLWKAIHIDGKIHPQEYKYLENIGQLVRYNPMKLKQMETDFANQTDIPDPPIAAKLKAHIYKYIVEIVMVDGEYLDVEAKFVQDIGALFGYDKRQQDAIIQPVASALMLRRSLFIY